MSCCSRNVDLRIPSFDTSGFEAVLGCAAQFPHNVVLGARQCLKLDNVIHFISLDALNAGHYWIRDNTIFQVRMVAYLGCGLAQHLKNFVTVFPVVYGNINLGHAPVASEIADHSEQAVGDEMDSAIKVAQDCTAQGELFHFARHGSGPNGVADAVLIIEQDEKPGQDIFHQGLRTKADGQSGDAGAGNQRLDRDAELLQDIEAAKYENNSGSGAVKNRDQGAKLLIAARVTAVTAEGQEPFPRYT